MRTSSGIIVCSQRGKTGATCPKKCSKERWEIAFLLVAARRDSVVGLAWDKPAPTLVTSPTCPATDLCHPEALRPLSKEKYAAIPTFPRDYIFEGALADKYRQIGNAVPCEFNHLVSNHIVAFDAGKLTNSKSPVALSRVCRNHHESWRDEAICDDASYLPSFDAVDAEACRRVMGLAGRHALRQARASVQPGGETDPTV